MKNRVVYFNPRAKAFLNGKGRARPAKRSRRGNEFLKMGKRL